jgi:hypothetical protein
MMNKKIFYSKIAKGIASLIAIIILLSSILATSVYYNSSITANAVKEVPLDSGLNYISITEVDDIRELSFLNEGWYEIRNGFVFYLDTFNSYVPLYIKILNQEQQNGLLAVDAEGNIEFGNVVNLLKEREVADEEKIEVELAEITGNALKSPLKGAGAELEAANKRKPPSETVLGRFTGVDVSNYRSQYHYDVAVSNAGEKMGTFKSGSKEYKITYYDQSFTPVLEEVNNPITNKYLTWINYLIPNDKVPPENVIEIINNHLYSVGQPQIDVGTLRVAEPAAPVAPGTGSGTRSITPLSPPQPASPSAPTPAPAPATPATPAAPAPPPAASAPAAPAAPTPPPPPPTSASSKVTQLNLPIGVITRIDDGFYFRYPDGSVSKYSSDGQTDAEKWPKIKDSAVGYAGGNLYIYDSADPKKGAKVSPDVFNKLAYNKAEKDAISVSNGKVTLKKTEKTNDGSREINVDTSQTYGSEGLLRFETAKVTKDANGNVVERVIKVQNFETDQKTKKDVPTTTSETIYKLKKGENSIDTASSDFTKITRDSLTGAPTAVTINENGQEFTATYNKQTGKIEVNDQFNLDSANQGKNPAFNQLNTLRNQQAWQRSIADVERVLTEFQGLGYYATLFFDEDKLLEWRSRVDRVFATAYLGTEYWSSAICSSYLDGEDEGIAYAETLQGLAQVAAHIEATRTEPLLTPTGQEFIYKITFRVKNGDYDKDRRAPEEMKVNVILKGEKTATVFKQEQKVKRGSSFGRAGRNAIVKESKVFYNEVCLTFDNVPFRWKVSNNEICNSIVESSGAPTAVSTATTTTTTTSGGGTVEGEINDF